ncbi:hypothetical protein Cgig2_017738 [Carnegiea gigantea]|uniref:HTH OST-type domain-containing protein n=1 Tax=Carnegiea gigantea TaxID=171969 RepID=A0A9Q1JMI7_9CARY|nr:hypothetical protein Cgig2_017738 [Carnegiea gigantea]
MARKGTNPSSTINPSISSSHKTQTSNSQFFLTTAMNHLSSTRKPLSHFLFSLSSSSSRPSASLLDFFFFFFFFFLPPLPSVPRRYDDDGRNVRVSVWWDSRIRVPSGSNVFKISQSIMAAVRANGIKGPFRFLLLGTFWLIGGLIYQALISFTFHGGRNSADGSLLVDLMHWVAQNPPPAHIFLISSDRDFAGILHRLRMNNYNILLAGREGKYTSGVLCSAATIMWQWEELAKGEHLSGRHFNQPPDGPFNSWYGHYKGPLEDPYDMPQQENSSKVNHSTNIEQSSEPQPLQVPKQVMKHVRDIVNSYPRGLPIGELRSQLENKVTIDRNYYGFKKFSGLLQSMRRIVKVIDRADGNFLIRPVAPRASEVVESDDTSAGSMTENGKQAVQVTPKAGEAQSVARMVNVEPILHASHHDVAKESLAEVTKVEEIPEKVFDGPEKISDGCSREVQFASAMKDDEKEGIDSQSVRSRMALTEVQKSKSEVGVFERLWTKWFGSSTGIERTDISVPDKFHSSSCSPEKSTLEEQGTKSPSEHETHGPNAALHVDAKCDKIAKSEVNPGFVGKAISWFKSWRNESCAKTLTEQLNEEQNVMDESRDHEDAPQSKKHELFFKDAFWNAFASFLRTYRGSDIVLNSTSREQLAKRLHIDGPLILRSLKGSDLLDLVDLLISEKKWIEEFPTQKPRFKILHLPGKRSASAQAPNSNASDEKSHSVLSSIMQKKPSEKSRSEILADCQKLLDELLLQNPEGFNMGIFKKKFLEKYRYSFDHLKLGYPKLVSLLQIMPGVKVESSCVYPDKVAYAPGIASLGSKGSSPGSDGEMSDSHRKQEDVESQWEELGPVANSNITKQEEQPDPMQIDQEYKPSMADDDEELSDQEGEEYASSSQLKADGKTKKKVNEEDSSLLKILNRWHATKDENNPEGLVDCSKEESGIEASSAAGNAQKQRLQKSYMFVSNSLESNKDKLIDGILGRLKNSGEQRVRQ